MKKNKQIERISLLYPSSSESGSKTFHIKYDKKLSSVAKLVLNSFKNKYLYYAMDDILYSFELNPKERNNLLEILKSLIVSLQNNFSINFLISGFMKFILMKYQKLISF